MRLQEGGKGQRTRHGGLWRAVECAVWLMLDADWLIAAVVEVELCGADWQAAHRPHWA